MSTQQTTSTTEPNRSTTIKYMNPEVPHVELPAYSGQRYEVMSPDTLDLQEMAALAINGLTEPTDPESDYEVYWRAAFNTNRLPIMWHTESDWVQWKFLQALPLLRTVSGSSQNYHVEQRWLEVIRQMQGPDGLFYVPRIGRPWCVFGHLGKEPPGDHYWSSLIEGTLLNVTTIYFLLTGHSQWRDMGRKVVDALGQFTVANGNKAHFPWHEFGAEGKFTPPDNPADAIGNLACFHSWTIQGLANYAKYTGYEPALDLSSRLAHWVIEDSHHFGPDGRFMPEYPDEPGAESHLGTRSAHFHAHTQVLLSLFDYGVISGDREAIDFVHRGFRYGMTQGECHLGYFPEWLYAPFTVPSEICEVAEMIALGVKLSKSGVGDYWDMVERWVRNLFCEAQVKREYREKLYWLAARIPATQPSPMEIPPYYSTDRVIERNTGAFVSTLGANDLLPGEFFYMGSSSDGIAHCCTGNAARAIYYVWENVVTHEAGNLKINLLLNRASQWADIDSHLPYAGQVDVKVKKSVELSVRLPEWVKPEQAKCTVNAGDRTLRSSGRYAMVGKVAPNDLVTLSFPIEERTERITVEKRTYRILMRGNTCVAIDPPGENVPLFHRDHYRSDTTRWRKVTRFLGKNEIEW